MADVFISYAHEDRPKVEKLAEVLEPAGFSVWWDRRLETGSEFSRDIEKELNEAKTAIVAWSAASVGSHWVRDEAAAARDAGKLVHRLASGSSRRQISRNGAADSLPKSTI